MRSEQEMTKCILSFARKDARVRAAWLNGSRANPNAVKDALRDYDVVFAVTELAGFLSSREWLNAFGAPAMVQEPDDLDGPQAPDRRESYTFLVLFEDANRIDLKLMSLALARKSYGADTLTVPLLDKDGFLPPLAPPSDRGYHVQRPQAPDYAACCNEFWWCTQNVAKGLWRGEITYARSMFERVVRPELDRMLSWRIGAAHEFRVSAGKFGKYFSRLLPEREWAQYCATYAGGDEIELWEALLTACALFRTAAERVAEVCGIAYPRRDDENMTRYLLWVRGLARETRGKS